MKVILIHAIFVFLLNTMYGQNSELALSKQYLAFSAIKGQKSKIDTLVIINNGITMKNVEVNIEGENTDFFKILSPGIQKLSKASTINLILQFQPSNDFIGVAHTRLVLHIPNDSHLSVNLNGLSTRALEGKNEPPLSWVIETLGYQIDLGWKTLGNHIKPELQGEELHQSLFKKAGSKDVEMIPLARYSPPFSLPFGYYTEGDSLPTLHEIGRLADSQLYPEHQTLMPNFRGETIFNPGSEAFGFYTTSPSHIAYSMDEWNKKLYPKHAAHACRIYPIKDAKGNTVPNQYLVCFEEAFNGDYQDYVFLLKNVKRVD